ncbi:MAG TPA: cytochrome c [Sphingomicrobium sp.]|jgi:cytochrome c556|nr:cytochrome c [Sphingomicrobium sp.]
MRLAVSALCVSFAMLAACGQSNQATDDPPAAASEDMPMVAVPLPKDKALQVMHVRHEGMEAMGKSAKAIARQLKSGSPDLGVIRSSSGAITSFAPKIASLFPAGTGPDVGKTGAKPEIWQTPQDFAAKAHDFERAAQAFGLAVRGNDVNAIKASFGNLGKDCKACHDKYRAEMHH